MKNFRDLSKFNLKIKKGQVYRASVFDLFNIEKIEKHDIKTIVDLRADREIDDIEYSEEIKNTIEYVKAPFDPWDQPEWFKEKYRIGTNHEIAYRFFAMGCKDSVKKVFENILEQKEGAIAIHCHAGKDRTGILFSMIHLLLEASIETIYTDYLASEMDVSLQKLNIALDVIKNEGGIKNYLLSCGLTESQISSIKKKLSNE
ncbi:hypothetical protein AAT17_12465 [Nonlabens sp. MIC269]|uniref:tyrosine-protein phosphatase n=1 Tax=Nonlabens sp. MIC269 TaxID=1476901 RepID=UPI00071EE73F|nr:tyrosine-protein phosphatase [Nonlabens sp. MIC269]ALM21987.1 hypothetical protein AAT17_12465 [Nonlabens sp. MIC269]